MVFPFLIEEKKTLMQRVLPEFDFYCTGCESLLHKNLYNKIYTCTEFSSLIKNQIITILCHFRSQKIRVFLASENGREVMIDKELTK